MPCTRDGDVQALWTCYEIKLAVNGCAARAHNNHVFLCPLERIDCRHHYTTFDKAILREQALTEGYLCAVQADDSQLGCIKPCTNERAKDAHDARRFCPVA